MNDIEYYEELEFLSECIKKAKNETDKKMFVKEYKKVKNECKELYPDMFFNK